MTITAVQPGLHAALSSPFTPIGYTPGGTPVYGAQGGRSGGGVEFVVDDGDGDEDPFEGRDDDDDDEGDEDDEDEAPPARRKRGQQADADGETDWTPPDREAWERVQEALKRANREAGQRRRVGKTMQRLGIDDLERWLTDRGIDPETGMPYGIDAVEPNDEGDGYGPDGDYEREDDARYRREDPRDARARDRELVRQIRTAEQRGRASEREALMPALAEATARLALRDAGFTGNAKQLDRMLRSIDPEDLDLSVDRDGFELVGMDEAIEQLREDFPQFFGADEEEERPARRRTARPSSTTARSRGAREVDGGNRGRQPAAPKGWQEKIAQQMLERGR